MISSAPSGLPDPDPGSRSGAGQAQQDSRDECRWNYILDDRVVGSSPTGSTTSWLVRLSGDRTNFPGRTTRTNA
jgi:hypothetical protein